MSFYEFDVLGVIKDKKNDTTIEKYFPQIVNISDVTLVSKHPNRDDLFNFSIGEVDGTGVRKQISIKSSQAIIDKVFGIKRGK